MPWDNNTGGAAAIAVMAARGDNRPVAVVVAIAAEAAGHPVSRKFCRVAATASGEVSPAGAWGLVGGALLLVAVWLFNSIYHRRYGGSRRRAAVRQAEARALNPGLHFHLWPVETVEKVSVAVNRTTIGGTTGARASDEGLMLSGDQNIADVRFTVFWSVANPIEFLFNVREPEDIVRLAAESAMREVVGRGPADDIFRDDAGGIASQVQDITQSILSGYGAGITVSEINIEYMRPRRRRWSRRSTKCSAPARTRRACRKRHGVTPIPASVTPAARPRRYAEQAAAYANQVVQEATGEAERFNQIYAEYVNAPDVTRQRLFPDDGAGAGQFAEGADRARPEWQRGDPVSASARAEDDYAQSAAPRPPTLRRGKP